MKNKTARFVPTALFASAILTTAAFSQTAPQHKGSGIVRRDIEAPAAQIIVAEALITQQQIKSSGTIWATLAVPPSHFKQSSPNGPFLTRYTPSAVLSVYRPNPKGGEDELVYTGSMEQASAEIQIALPPNELEPPRTAAFLMPVNPGSGRGLNLQNGNYRAEVVFYVQEFGPIQGLSVGWQPEKVVVAGAAAQFTVADFALSPVSEVRGEITVSASVIPRPRATASQIAQLKALANAEASRVNASVKAFLSKYAQKEPAGGASRVAWIYGSSSSPQNGMVYLNFTVAAGQVFSASTQLVQTELGKIVAAGNISKTTATGSYSVKTSTNIKFHPKN